MAGLGISLNFSYKKEHVLDIELLNNTFKELVRYAQSAMPFKRISKLMIAHLVATAIFWLNAFPPSKPGRGLSNKKCPEKHSLELSWNTRNFSTYSQANMPRCIKRMNTGTRLIYIKQSEKLYSDFLKNKRRGCSTKIIAAVS